MIELLSEIKKNIPTDKKIGVMVSGGFDSALLWYIVKDECEKRQQECIPFTVPKLDGAKYHAAEVVKKINQVLGLNNQDIVLVGKDLANSDENLVTDGVLEIRDKNLVEHVYIGMTAFADEVISLTKRKIVPSPRYIPTEQARKKVTWPFENLTKDKIIKLAIELDLLDIIAPISHTCTIMPKGRCGKCYWCTERAWAFKQNKIKDIGTN